MARRLSLSSFSIIDKIECVCVRAARKGIFAILDTSGPSFLPSPSIIWSGSSFVCVLCFAFRASRALLAVKHPCGFPDDRHQSPVPPRTTLISFIPSSRNFLQSHFEQEKKPSSKLPFIPMRYYARARAVRTDHSMCVCVCVCEIGCGTAKNGMFCDLFLDVETFEKSCEAEERLKRMKSRYPIVYTDHEDH